MDFFTKQDGGDDATATAVRDPVRVVVQTALAVSLAIIAYGIADKPQRWPLVVILGALTLLFVLAARASWNGVVVDTAAGTAEFPGGGISANNVFELLSPSWLFQIARRQRIALKQINHIRRITERAPQQRRGHRVRLHYLSVQGSFGAIRVHFISEGKRDQAFALLREVCHAGAPVTRS